ncbi:MAG: biotin-dependent carboxyltransferase family protein, partial [Rhodospirillales bacterium]
EVTQADGGIFRVPTFQSLRVQAGERVRVLPLAGSVTAVLAVAGGFAVEPVMGSASTDLRSALGGFQGRALRSGDRLPVNGDCDPPTRFFPQPEDWLSVAPVRLVPGPQWDAFSEAAQKALFDSPFRISKDADRMGLRLEGPALTHRAGADIVSDGIATGALQVPGSGQPILLLADRQTAGGYAKIAHVASVDLPRLGRLPPGTSLSFSRITREEAENLRRGRDRDLRRALADCPLLLEGRHIDLDALYSANLVSGVVDGNDPDR